MAEAAYVGFLTAESSTDLADPAVAAAIIYRVFSWVIIIPLGAIGWLWWSHGRKIQHGEEATSLHAMVERAGYFIAVEGQPRVRRARDAVRIGVGLIFMTAFASDAVRLGQLQEAMTDVIRSLPGWAEVVFWVSYGAAAIYAAGLIVAVLVRARRDVGVARDVVLAALAALAIAVLAMRWQEGIWPTLLPEFGAEDPAPLFPMIRVAVVTAIVLALSPHATRELRRIGYLMVSLVAVAGISLEFGYPSDAVAAVGIGMVAASGILLALGSPIGFPNVAVVSSALTQLGVRVNDLTPAADQSWGTRRLVGTDNEGVPIEVKAYGRDAADTQVATKAWQALWYRDSGPTFAYTRMQAVEHEALVAMFAERAGVKVAEPITAGLAGDDVAILAVRRPGRPLSELTPEEIADDTLLAIWRGVAALHRVDMAHGSLSVATVFVTEDDYLFDDFSSGAMAAGERRQLDIAALLFSLSVHLGVDRAVSTARTGLGEDRLAAAIPYLQLPALSPAARRAVAKPKALMKDLKRAVVAATGVDMPEDVKLRRVSAGSLVMAALLLFAANALITQLAGVDYEVVWSVIKDAAWVALILALAVSHLSFVPEATGMKAVVGRPLPMKPLVILQFSSRFIGLAVPSAAGRVAMNSAFLVKLGVTRTVAVVQGAIDGVSGFVVEAVILGLALIFSDASFDLGGDTDWQRILAIVVAVAIIGLLGLALIARVRNVVLPLLKDALGSVTPLLRDPRRTMTLLFSNVLARLLLGATLWLILRAVDVEVTLPVALTVTVATTLLAGLVPIPGGIGVAEAVMTSWLVLVGVPEAEAFAVTVVYRMWTFYLPAFEGFFAMRWLEANDYI